MQQRLWRLWGRYERQLARRPVATQVATSALLWYVAVEEGASITGSRSRALCAHVFVCCAVSANGCRAAVVPDRNVCSLCVVLPQECGRCAGADAGAEAGE